MANYHLHVKTGSKKKGQSASAKNDYITRSGKYSRDSDEVLFSESGHMPMWAADASDYWKGADTYERSNGRLYKEIEFSLPLELDLDQKIDLAKSFAQHLTEKENLPFTLVIHSGKGHNPHVHLMISERVNDGLFRSPERWFKRHDRKKPDQSGARKTDKLKPKKWLYSVRKDWASLANFALERAGFDERIDHRTLVDQGIDRVPQIHIGQAAMALERKGIITDRGSEALEIQRVNEEYERLKRAEREQKERTPDRTAESRTGEVNKTERVVQRKRKEVVKTRKQPGPQNGKMENNGPGIWGRISGWVANRFGHFWSRDSDLVQDSKPDVNSEVDPEFERAESFFTDLRKKTPEQRAVEAVKAKMDDYREVDRKRLSDYENDLASKPKSLPSSGRNREF